MTMSNEVENPIFKFSREVCRLLAEAGIPKEEIVPVEIDPFGRYVNLVLGNDYSTSGNVVVGKEKYEIYRRAKDDYMDKFEKAMKDTGRKLGVIEI